MQEQQEFDNIRELRELVFSIKAIKEMKTNQQVLGCSSEQQLSANHHTILNELETIERDVQVLLKRQEKL